MACIGTKTVAIVAMPGVQLLDVSGPLDVFAEANVKSGKAVYRQVVVGRTRGQIRSSSGVRILPDLVISEPSEEKIDTLLVAGSPTASVLKPDKVAVQWLRETAPKTRRFGSVCAGAFLLAAAGLLDRRRITTHWAVARRLAEAYPSVTIDEDAIYVRDGRLRTAAGVTSGLDLALALVEEDLGSEVAKNVAAQLVMFFKRPGGQMQFSRKSEVAPAGRSALQEVQRWVVANPAAPHSVASLANRMALSPRHFARLFRSEVGMTPAAWIELSRIAAARRMLEEGKPPKEVAVRCGFMGVDTLRRSFARHVGVTPAEYRKRFGRRET